MAGTINKKDIIAKFGQAVTPGAAPGVPGAAAPSTFDKVMQLINHPIVQPRINAILDKVQTAALGDIIPPLPPGPAPDIMQPKAQKPSLTKKDVVGMIDNYLGKIPDQNMTVKDLRAWIKKQA